MPVISHIKRYAASRRHTFTRRCSTTRPDREVQHQRNLSSIADGREVLNTIAAICRSIRRIDPEHEIAGVAVPEVHAAL